MSSVAPYVDCEFAWQSHADRMMGCLPRQEPFGKVCALFRDGFETLSKSEITERCKERQAKQLDALVRIKDQNGEGTCTANAGTQAGQIVWGKQFGLDQYIEFSPISTYRFCASGPGTGSSLDCNLKRMRDHGMLPVSNDHSRAQLKKWGLPEEHTLKAVGYSQRFPSGWEETAKHFRVSEFFDIDRTEEFFTALLLGHPVWYGRSGHSILAIEPVLRDGKLCARYANSWGSWGDGGYGYDSWEYISRAGGGYGAFAVRAMHAPAFVARDVPAPAA